MAIAKLSETYAVEIPQEFRDAMKLKPGEELIFIVHDDIGSFMVKPADVVAELGGFLTDVYPEGYLEEERKNWR